MPETLRDFVGKYPADREDKLQKDVLMSMQLVRSGMQKTVLLSSELGYQVTAYSVRGMIRIDVIVQE